jgi:cysteine desulfurase family protein (TIGR01976 family)
MTASYDLAAVRGRFPALSRSENGPTAAYLDGPGGTQVPEAVIDAMSTVLADGVSNLGGDFGASRDAERITDEARAAMALLVNADPEEIVFGQNMTSLTFAMSRALARTWESGDSVVLTSLDHDANFTPWDMAADDSGVYVRVAEFDPETGLLDSGAVIDSIDDSTRLVAVCLASNALGTVVDIAAIASAAHEVGALVYVDAVHAAPHRLIDVDALDCDFLVASSYKFYGPHTGALFGRSELLDSLDAYKVRPAPSGGPGKWETGTQSFESLAGFTAAVGHIASLGTGDGRDAVVSAFESITAHERSLGRRFLDGISGLSRVVLYGVSEMDDRRVTTFALAVDGTSPREVTTEMARRGVYVWAGNYYAVNVMDRLGRPDGLVRIGFCHYNSPEEVDRALEVLASL